MLLAQTYMAWMKVTGTWNRRSMTDYEIIGPTLRVPLDIPGDI